MARPITCFTSATFSYFDRVRTLGLSIREHHPDWRFVVALCDQEPPGFMIDLASEPFDEIIRVDDLAVENLKGWMYEHDLVELCTAVKGIILCKLLSEHSCDVVYLDPDIAIFSPLIEVTQRLPLCNVMLTPHQLSPDLEKTAIVDNEIGSLKYGIYNLGFIAVSNTSEGRRFASWWRDRLLDFCFDDVPNGLFTDQRWCDHVPSFFDCVEIIKHRGYNVASWNISQREITFDSEGNLLAGGQQIRFFHFTKVTWVGEFMLERYCHGRVEVFELMKWYRIQLKVNSAKNVPSGWWAFGAYRDGSKISKSERRAFRHYQNAKTIFDDPFLLGKADGCPWL